MLTTFVKYDNPVMTEMSGFYVKASQKNEKFF
jgi:hypothetical protein